MKILFTIALQLVFFLSSFAQSGELTITLDNFDDKKGKVYVGVFTEQNFLRNPTYSGVINLDAGKAQVTMKDVKYGTYAVSIFYDTNGNTQLDMDEYGRPTEPWALSGKPTSMIPVWSEAKFNFDSTNKAVSLKL